MPRLLDKLDAAAGFTPEALDHGIDYLTMQPGPAQLIDATGVYNAGWFDAFTGVFNFEDSYATELAFQKWVHLSIDAPERFIIFNIADLTRAGNIALLVAHKETGRFEQASQTRIFPRNNLTVSDEFRRFSDPDTRSFALISPDHTQLRFSVHVDHIHLTGIARQAIAPPLTQITRFQRARGSLQRYGNLEIVEALLTVGEEIISIPPGTLCTYDHTIGHQRGLQAWNWVAAAGHAVCTQTGASTRIGLQMARDRPAARPMVDGHKHGIWLDGRLYKIPSVTFSYQHTDAETHETSAWRIHSPRGGTRWLELYFQPRFHRRENRYLWLLRSDFNQYYGTLSGEIHIDGRTWNIADLFAVTEESLLEL